MSNDKGKIKITVDNKRAEKETQILLRRSTLEYSEDVKKIEKELEYNQSDVRLWMDKGLALAKQMLFREATEAFSIGLSYEPFNWLLLRHRGHRYLSTYRFEDAVADFELASRINDKDWDIWYHLGLSYYLVGDFQRADIAYTKCLELTNKSDIKIVAIVDWKWLTLNRLGNKRESEKVLELVDENTEAGENQPYKDRIMVYKEIIEPEKAMEFDNDKFADLEYATRGYGVALFYYYKGEKEKAKIILNKILEKKEFWSAFGYLAAYQEINTGRLEWSQ